MTSYILTNRQARHFILRKQGLIGDYRFIGKKGVLDFVHQTGCIQYDPIDVCGKNAELVLQSRVKGFTKQMLGELLYKDRTLLDYFDKNLAIIETCDWPYFERYREAYRNGGRSRSEVNAVCEEIKLIIREKGPVSSSDIGFNDKVRWYWSDTRLSRAALESMYFRGDLIVHHKKGTVKYYDLTEKHISDDLLEVPEPCPDELEHRKWRVLRRISAVGLLWNRASDAWLNIEGLKAEERNEIFRQLVKEEKIIEVSVENIKDRLYGLASDRELLEDILKSTDFKSTDFKSTDFKSTDLKSTDSKRADLKGRCELLAPLDNMLWDRKLIKALFDFDYKWEIYTPEADRKYGYYVLPILYGDRFIGRVEVVNDKKAESLMVKNIWFEESVKPAKMLQKTLDKCLQRFAKFNGCKFVR